MTLTRRQLAIGGAAALGLAVAAGYSQGRRSAPEKVKVETKVEYRDRIVEKVVTVKAKDVQRKVTTKTEKRPDGSSVVLKVEDTTSHADLGRVSDFTGTSTGTLSTATTTASRPGWRLGVGVEWSGVHEKPDALRLEVDRRIVGPIWLGLRASTDRTAGAALSLEF